MHSMNAALLIAILVVAAFAAALAYPVISTFHESIKPAKTVSNETPADFGLEFESFKLATSDNLKLDAWHVPAAKKTNRSVIVLHGYPYDKGSVLKSSLFLQGDFNLLFLDFRYLGRSEGGYTSLGYHERKDVKAAVEYLSKRSQSIGIYGRSMGGSAALMGADENVKAIFADSPYASVESLLRERYGSSGIMQPVSIAIMKALSRLLLGISISEISAEKSVRFLDVPILILHGTADEQVPVGNAHSLKAANPEIELWIIEGLNHNDERNFSGSGYEERVRSFFRKNLN